MLKYYLHFAGHLGIESKQCQKIVNEERILEKLVLNFKLNSILYVNQVKLEPDNN